MTRMLKVEVPTLLNLTPQLFEGLFDKYWPDFLMKELRNNPQWYPLRDEFKYTAISVCIEAFTAWLQELYDSINTHRMFTLEHVEVNAVDVYEGYTYEEGITATGLSQQDVEEQIFAWIDWLMEKLTCADFVTQVEAVFMPMHENLNEIKKRYALLGYWYDCYATTSTLWSSSTCAYGIAEGDFEALHYGAWKYGFGTQWHELSSVAHLDFYLSNGLFYTDNCVSQIPKDALVTMCRIHKNVAEQLTLY